MGSSSFGGSQRFEILAQQLRLYKPLCPLASTNNNNVSENPKVQDSAGDVVPQELDLNTQSMTNPIPNRPERLRPNRAAVLICIFEGEEGDLRVILTKRSSKLSSHSGEVSLPGGKVEEGDANDIETALREANEEIGLDPSLVNVVTVLESFSTKENQTDRILLHRQVENGLYPIVGMPSLPHKLYGLAVTIGEKASVEQWHSRLGHPSQAVLQSFLRANSISLSSKTNKSTFCYVCPLGQSKQLPFSDSTRQSTNPFVLVHFWRVDFTCSFG